MPWKRRREEDCPVSARPSPPRSSAKSRSASFLCCSQPFPQRSPHRSKFKYSSKKAGGQGRGYTPLEYEKSQRGCTATPAFPSRPELPEASLRSSSAQGLMFMTRHQQGTQGKLYGCPFLWFLRNTTRSPGSHCDPPGLQIAGAWLEL